MTQTHIAQVELPRTHRPEFFAGEILHAADLEDVVASERSLRWLHNRALHGWGIGLGLDVDGARGATSVSVGIGYAVDGAGRDLVLEQPVTLPVPAIASAPDGKPADYLLVLVYTEDEAAAVQLRDGACDATGAVRRDDDPTIAWRVPQAVRDGLDIVLAAAKVAGCALAAPLVTAQVRRALGAIPSPHVASAQSQPVWRRWPEHGPVAGVTATIDTSAGGFGDTPAYQVTLMGPRALSATALLDGHPHVENAGMLSFDVVVPLPAGFIGRPDKTETGAPPNYVSVNPPETVADPDALVHYVADHWRIEWIGVETG
jgi:hypothetical protein